jgi:hypothetical protein
MGEKIHAFKINCGASAADWLLEKYLRLLCNKNFSQDTSTLHEEGQIRK